MAELKLCKCKQHYEVPGRARRKMYRNKEERKGDAERNTGTEVFCVSCFSIGKETFGINTVTALLVFTELLVYPLSFCVSDEKPRQEHSGRTSEAKVWLRRNPHLLKLSTGMEMS